MLLSVFVIVIVLVLVLLFGIATYAGAADLFVDGSRTTRFNPDGPRRTDAVDAVSLGEDEYEGND